MYWQQMPLETRLVTAVTAAETLHRGMSNLKGITDENHNALMACLDGLNEETRQWATDRLRRNEPSLKNRLLDMISNLDPEVVQYLIPSSERWATLAKNLRNEVAHGLKLTNDEQVEQAYAMIVTTMAIATLALLPKLGVPADKIYNMVEDNPAFGHVRSLARSYLRPVPNRVSKRRKKSNS